MHRSLWIIQALLLTACATPYRPALDSRDLGYRETLLAPGTYSIVFTARPATPHDQAERLAQRRALEICPHGFSLLEADLRSIEVSSCHSQCSQRTVKAQVWVSCHAR